MKPASTMASTMILSEPEIRRMAKKRSHWTVKLYVDVRTEVVIDLDAASESQAIREARSLYRAQGTKAASSVRECFVKEKRSMTLATQRHGEEP